MGDHTLASVKKHLLLALRIVFAALGVAYIIWIVQWVDLVKAPAGTVLPNGHRVESDTTYKVISGRYNPRHPDLSASLQIQISPDGQTLQLPVTELHDTDNTLQFMPGAVTMVRQARRDLLAVGLLMVAPIQIIVMVRWWLLLLARGMNVPFWKAFGLTMVGNFFNFCLPGTTGGDLVKAYYAAKGSGRRADAIMTVIVDRIIGLFGLVLLAGMAGLCILEHPTARKITINIWLATAAILLGSALYFSSRMRKLLMIDWLLGKLPMGQIVSSVDQAAVAYRHHKSTLFWATIMSVAVHLCISGASAMVGFALGMDSSIGLLLTVVPVLFLVGAVPISFQGVGLMEFVGKQMLYNPPAITANQIVGMLMMIRLYQMFYSLFGALFLLKGDIHLHPQQLGDDQQEATADSPSARSPITP